MSAFDEVDKRELKELLSKGWMTHDGMWFYHCFQEFGIEKANKMNRAAIKSLAPFEMKRVKKILGVEREAMETFEEFKDFLFGSFELISSDFMKVTFNSTSKNVINWEWKSGQCFAYEGMKRIGAIDGYLCGVMYRIGCWIESLGVEYSITPRIDGCLMHTEGSCSGELRFYFQD